MNEICSSEAIQEASPRTIEVNGTPYILLRKQGKLYGYVNQCPHLGVELNWKPDQVLDHSREFFQCTTHGALFRLQDGFCIEGPCAGQHLSPVKLIEQNNKIYLGEAPA